jgi:hypothetical protein
MGYIIENSPPESDLKPLIKQNRPKNYIEIDEDS